METIVKYKIHLEVGVHTLFWLFILTSINIHWSQNWFLTSTNNESVPPLALVFFAFYFYANAFYLLPKYFSRKHWKLYFMYAFLVFTGPEIVRLLFYKIFVFDRAFVDLLYHRDSFIFGSPSPLLLALNASIAYRLIADRLFSIPKSKRITEPLPTNIPSKGDLNVGELEMLKKHIIIQLEEAQIFLLPKLGIAELAEYVNSTEKKVSYVINHYMNSSFVELINHYRIEQFKAAVALDKNRHLSIVGIAMNSGFSSKSSFYRIFKSKVGMTPSQYVKSLK